MNERTDTAPAGRREAAAAGPEDGPWLDERAALTIVMRLRPELSREEAEGQLLVFHC